MDRTDLLEMLRFSYCCKKLFQVFASHKYSIYYRFTLSACSQCEQRHFGWFYLLHPQLFQCWHLKATVEIIHFFSFKYNCQHFNLYSHEFKSDPWVFQLQCTSALLHFNGNLSVNGSAVFPFFWQEKNNHQNAKWQITKMQNIGRKKW